MCNYFQIEIHITHKCQLRHAKHSLQYKLKNALKNT